MPSSLRPYLPYFHSLSLPTGEDVKENPFSPLFFLHFFPPIFLFHSFITSSYYSFPHLLPVLPLYFLLSFLSFLLPFFHESFFLFLFPFHSSLTSLRFSPFLSFPTFIYSFPYTPSSPFLFILPSFHPSWTWSHFFPSPFFFPSLISSCFLPSPSHPVPFNSFVLSSFSASLSPLSSLLSCPFFSLSFPGHTSLLLLSSHWPPS